MKKCGREPNQTNLEIFGIQVTATKRPKHSEDKKDKLEPAARKLIAEETTLAQLKIINEDIQPPNLFKN